VKQLQEKLKVVLMLILLVISCKLTYIIATVFVLQTASSYYIFVQIQF